MNADQTGPESGFNHSEIRCDPRCDPRHPRTIAPDRPQDYTAAITSAPFWPPNPKLVDSPNFTFPSRAVFGM